MNLRDRIAAVQKAHIFCLVECSCGYQIDSIHPSSPDWKTDAECDWADHVADAVIEALDEDYDPYEAKADAERQQWADDEGIPR